MHGADGVEGDVNSPDGKNSSLHNVLSHAVSLARAAEEPPMASTGTPAGDTPAAAAMMSPSLAPAPFGASTPACKPQPAEATAPHST